MIIDSEQRENQRFEYLVLGRLRPRTATTGPAGRRSKSRKAKPPAKLAPGIEERVQLRERWSHKQGTPETHEHAEATRQRPGSIARLYESGTIDAEQLAAADAIREAHRAITADVAVRTASFETRIDAGTRDFAHVPIGAAIADLAYDHWRRMLAAPAEPVLAVIIDDIALTVAARRYRVSDRRMRALLIDALDLWREGRQRAWSKVRAPL